MQVFILSRQTALFQSGYALLDPHGQQTDAVLTDRTHPAQSLRELSVRRPPAHLTEPDEDKMEPPAMRSTRLHTLLGVAACLLGLTIVPHATAQQTDQQAPQHGPTAEQKAELERMVHEAIQQDIRAVAQYKLPKDFFAHMLPLTRQIRVAHIIPPTQTTNMTLATTIRRTEAMPELQALLQQYGLSARDFVMSITAFQMTAERLNDTGARGKNIPALDPDNVTLLRTHQGLMQALLNNMDEESEHLQ
ncbi:hypothetical protein [Komagataeibacter medellinensis]|nr:hypothetical protein [Komagataeibacter medellinensis]